MQMTLFVTLVTMSNLPSVLPVFLNAPPPTHLHSLNSALFPLSLGQKPTFNGQHNLLPWISQDSSPDAWKPFSVPTISNHSASLLPLTTTIPDPLEGHPHGPRHHGHHPTYFQTRCSLFISQMSVQPLSFSNKVVLCCIQRLSLLKNIF